MQLQFSTGLIEALFGIISDSEDEKKKAKTSKGTAPKEAVTMEKGNKSQSSRKRASDSVDDVDKKKRGKKSKKESTGKNTSTPGKTPISHSFAPPTEHAGGNEILWTAALGGDYHLKLQKWDKNNKLYVCLRRNQNIGANVGSEYFWRLYEAMQLLAEEMKDYFPPKEEIAYSRVTAE